MMICRLNALERRRLIEEEERLKKELEERKRTEKERTEKERIEKERTNRKEVRKMTPGPTPKGADRASTVRENRDRILNNIRQHPGTSVNAMSDSLAIPYTLVKTICDGLVAEERIRREVNGKKHRYYDIDYKEPAPVKRPVKSKFAPAPGTLIAKANEEGKDPRGPCIPEIKSYTPIPPEQMPVGWDTAHTEDDTVKSTPTPVPAPAQTRKDTENDTEKDTGTKVKADTRTKTSAPSAPPEDIDKLADQLAALKAMPRGTSLDAQFDAMEKDIEDRMSHSVILCPFCGAVPVVERTVKGPIVNCTCGLAIALYKGGTMTDLVKRYNARAA